MAPDVEPPRTGAEQTIKVASKKESRPGTIKLKKPPPKHNKPGNWRDGSVIEDEKKKAVSSPCLSAPSPGPVVNQLDETARETFATGRPLEDSPDLQQCKHCKKSILTTAAKAHITQCLKLKKEKAQQKKEKREARERAKEAAREEEARKAHEDNADADSDDGDKKGGPAAKRVGKKPDDDKKAGGKKRKAEGEPEKGPKTKKKKDEAKAKAAKPPKGPVDVEKQCGVTLPNGQPCARSLTCKSHSMGFKRAVAGRSLPYDMLLAAYQKKNQAKQQKAALDANAPIEDDDANAGPVDSDEETAAIMSALSHWQPQPLIPQPVFAPIKRQYQLSRLHEQLQLATNGGRTNIFQVVGYGAQRVAEGHADLPPEGEDAPGKADIGPLGFPASARSSTFGGGVTSQRSSISSRA
ncbi:uncharacterized protein UV8b_06374 [Ustilaginoidea virens]|uniref:SCA7 domain-containing protein n=1 Tax=Ustilaginoidea virens TaxID=1159556 RepID=A0A063C7J4_USTVR|nr:uncharacterized protein UV8b_06374 [Ustilaginoidea virens]QUC22133.1 hypothetical protein UV8b_06374 [Ustilaginoidea virens]GAO16450.1 hypothetical protein UVI_02048100 [Ustilaginoidea virens]